MDALTVVVEDIITVSGARNDSATRQSIRERVMSWHGEETRDLREENAALRMALLEHERRKGRA